jgi:hypothetical protein
MKRKNIFRNESQKLDAAFIEAGLPERVLLVPLDFAKRRKRGHFVMF